MSRLTIQGNYSYNDAVLTATIPNAVTYRLVPGDYSYRFGQGDAIAGDRLPNSAKNSGSLGATYTMPAFAGDLSFDWTATYRGDIVSRLGWDRYYGELIPGYVVHRASITYDTDKFSLSLFANNIFDKYAIATIDNDHSRQGINDGVVVRYYRQTMVTPRTFGIEGRFKF